MAEWLRASLAPGRPARRAARRLVECALTLVLMAIAVILARGLPVGQVQDAYAPITGSLGG
jgi:hypothetical protein